MLPLRNGLMWICLTLSFSACATFPQSVPPPKQIRERPPASLLVVVPVPRFVGFRNGELLDLVDGYHEALGQCNANIDSIRKWSEK